MELAGSSWPKQWQLRTAMLQGVTAAPSPFNSPPAALQDTLFPAVTDGACCQRLLLRDRCGCCVAAPCLGQLDRGGLDWCGTGAAWLAWPGVEAAHHAAWQTRLAPRKLMSHALHCPATVQAVTL